jgi:hypothetical protein
MISEQPNFIALYAAGLSTIIALWNFYQWWIKGPKLVGRAASNMVTYGGAPQDGNTYCVLTVSNRGDAPTTVTNLGLLGYKSRLQYLINRHSKAAVITAGGLGHPVPCQLVPGNEFTGFAIQNAELEKWSRDHLLFMCMWHSMSNKPFRVRLKSIANEGGNG